MLKRRNLVLPPTFCVAALLTLFIAGMPVVQVAVAQVVAQAPCPENTPCLQNTAGPCPHHAPCRPHAQALCYPYRCCERCTPNCRYWGYWPTTWRQWPQRRPDIWFPQGSGSGLEKLQAPQGIVPEQLLKEEPVVSPTAPGDSWLPPVGEGPATGPGAPGAPFDFNQNLDQGPGFDQNLPAMENLPAEPPSPMTLPIEGTEDSGMGAPAANPPAPDNSSFDKIPDDSVLTQQPRIPSSSNDEPASVEEPSLKEKHLIETTRLSPLADNNVETASDLAGTSRKQMQRFRKIEEFASTVNIKHINCESEENESSDPLAPRPGDTCLASVRDDTIHQTTFESPAEPWTVFKTGEPGRIHDRSSLPEMAEIEQTNSALEPQSHDRPAGSRTPVGLNGYCPVALVHNESWVLGDSRFAVEFEGRTYLLSGPRQHRAFRSNPERYAPVDSGFDPVLSFEEKTQCLGRTDACAVFKGRLYMFADADSLARFQSNPNRYTRALKRKRK